jgi:uncharacterized membrane protein YvbJ
MFCEGCGNEISAEAIICMGCGRAIDVRKQVNADDKPWNSNAMLGLILASVFAPYVGIILGITHLNKEKKKKQSIILLSIGVIFLIAQIVLGVLIGIYFDDKPKGITV